MDSASEDNFVSESDTFLYSRETDFPEEEGTGKEELTNSDIVGRNHGENVDENSRQWDEREQTFERVKRSSEIFDDDVESSEGRSNRGRRKVKDTLNKAGRRNDRGKNRWKGLGKGTERKFEDSYEKHSLIRENRDNLTNVFPMFKENM
jgi:hypothetical protein